MFVIYLSEIYDIAIVKETSRRVTRRGARRGIHQRIIYLNLIAVACSRARSRARSRATAELTVAVAACTRQRTQMQATPTRCCACAPTVTAKFDVKDMVDVHKAIFPIVVLVDLVNDNPYNFDDDDQFGEEVSLEEVDALVVPLA